METSRDPRLAFLSSRTSALGLGEPAPRGESLDAILEASTSVPDHGGLRPFRFVVVDGQARERFGQALSRAALDVNPDLSDAARSKIVQKAYFAPLLVALVSSPRAGAKVPVWEQEASAACTGFALVLAAEALGYGAVWKSAPVHEGPAIQELLSLSVGERFLGWVNLGTHAREVRPRAPSDWRSLVKHL